MVKVKISHPNKVLFPGIEADKGELARYYKAVAPYMLRHVRGRPVSLQRFPRGVDAQGFFQKDIPEYFPDWMPHIKIAKEGGTLTQTTIDGQESLRYIVNQDCITPHVWLSRVPHLHRPDRLVFDLDPPGEDFAEVKKAAVLVGELLQEIGLKPFVMATGSRGLHVWTPLRPQLDFNDAREFARELATLLVHRHHEMLTLEPRKAKRGDRILVDIMRNGYAQTVVAPYAVRARPDAPVATPLRWDELKNASLSPDGFTIRDIPGRLRQEGDPWAEIGHHRRNLAMPRQWIAMLERRDDYENYPQQTSRAS